MNVAIEPSWQAALAPEFTKDYFVKLREAVRQAYLTDTVYPPPKLLFHAFDQCPLPAVRVVILGQDPYHGPGQAHGLSFSVPKGVRIPPSLQNIYKEIAADVGTNARADGNLERWAQQGVLLLNSTLTVRAGSAASHQKLGWEHFTDAVIGTVSEQRSHVVFLLWGSFAGSKRQLINETKHLVLTAPHPSPLSAHRGFFGCRHFSQTNQYLRDTGQTPIVW
jgi:uracil-DNA glycosylase